MSESNPRSPGPASERDASAASSGSQRIRALAVVLRVDEPESLLRARSAQAIGIDAGLVRGLSIARRALDARRRGRRHELKLVYHVDLELPAELRSSALEQALRAGRARRVPPPARFELPAAARGGAGARAGSGVGAGAGAVGRVAVVGSGPAGLYAAWCLAANGVAVDLIERGPALRARSRAVAHFTRTRELDPEANLLFGEGGAGTYSDGKLYTRTQHALEAPILETLVEAGAPPEIRFDARAHVGTDRLHRILPALRARLEAMGVRFHFETRLQGFVASAAATSAAPRRVRALRTTQGELACDAVVLALGHSARDTIAALAAEGLAVEPKPFQIGLRIEHPQALVDAGRYGEARDPARLGHAYYALVAKAEADTLAVHSFCMCPGGQIVAAVAQPGLLCTNGMSNSRHSSPFANSGLVVTLGPKEYGGDPFGGWRLQAKLEADSFAAGGGDYRLPAQRVVDFLAGRESRSVPRSSCKLGQSPARLDRLLPDAMTRALQAAILRFDREIPGFAGEEGLLVGIESRSSGPLRMTRDPVARHSTGFENVYPVGEGAGHAGGIMSAAIDGARSAWALLGHRE